MLKKVKRSIIPVVMAIVLGLSGAIVGAGVSQAASAPVSGSGFPINAWYPWATPRYHDGNILAAFSLSGTGCDAGGGGAFSMRFRNTDASIIGTNSWNSGTRYWALFSSRWFYLDSRYDYQGGVCTTGWFSGTLTY